MPTWRNWLRREGRDNKGLIFSETEYCKRWNEFLQSPALDGLLQKYGKRLLFYPHRNMQLFLDDFSSPSERVEIADWKKYDIQDVLKRAALMITDYSSVFFDFAYMRKPVLFYQFDEAEFREKQYAEGYLNYHDTPLGKWTDSLSGVLALLESELRAGCPLLGEETASAFFPYFDDKNCERIYYAVKELKNK